jgi:hypothetical protein
MYNWYWRAEICYAYMSDICQLDTPLSHSAWFSRGWTLQELLAPAVVEFYSHDWERIGTKSSQAEEIRRATGIEKKFFLNRRNIRSAPVGTKFSWAARRETTRPEDMAYSLLGIFEVNMPMLYGEGVRAFHRLQLEILKQTPDHTIFVWEPRRSSRGQGIQHNVPIPMKVPPQNHWNILAPSPTWFDNHRLMRIRPSDHLSSSMSSKHEMTNMGIRIVLPCYRYSDGKMLGFLNCQSANNLCVAVPLMHLRDRQYARIPREPIKYISPTAIPSTIAIEIFLEVNKDQVSPESHYSATLQVSSLKVWDYPSEEVWNIRLVPIESWGATPHSRPLVREDVRRGITLQNQQCGALVLRNGDSGISVLFADHQHFTYMKLLVHDKPVNYRQIFAGYHQDIETAPTNGESDFFRDHLEQNFRDFSLVASVRTTFKAEFRVPCWRLSIQIWNTAAGRPDTRTPTDRTYFEL